MHCIQRILMKSIEIQSGTNSFRNYVKKFSIRDEEQPTKVSGVITLKSNFHISRIITQLNTLYNIYINKIFSIQKVKLRAKTKHN